MNRIPRLLFLLLLVPILTGNAVFHGKTVPAEDAAWLRELLSQPHRRLTTYAFDPATPIMNRVVPLPAATLAWLQELDGNPRYRDQALSAAERARLAATIDSLPPLVRRAMQERLVAIHIVREFLGAGMTDFVPDAPVDGHSVLFLSHAVFTNSFATWINMREASAFAPGRYRLSYEVAGDLTALHYALLHEGAHVADYAYGLTPVVEREQERARVALGRGPAGAWQSPGRSAFTDGIWRNITRPLPQYDYPGRLAIRFYGQAGPPLSAAERLPEMARRLAGTPFPSFYASLSWAENLAESLTFYHLTHALGLKVRMLVLEGTDTVFACEWVTNRAAAGQKAFLRRFYE